MCGYLQSQASRNPKSQASNSADADGVSKDLRLCSAQRSLTLRTPRPGSRRPGRGSRSPSRSPSRVRCKLRFRVCRHAHFSNARRPYSLASASGPRAHLQMSKSRREGPIELVRNPYPAVGSECTENQKRGRTELGAGSEADQST